jgi:hypothetical protein
MYVKTNVDVVINFWTYQLDPGNGNFIKFSYQLGVWTWHWVLFQMFITGLVWYLVKDWSLAGLRQVYTWCWNSYRIGTMLLLAQGPPTLDPCNTGIALRPVFLCLWIFCSHAKNKKEIFYHNLPGFSEKIVKLNNLLFEKLSPNLDSDFSLVPF